MRVVTQGVYTALFSFLRSTVFYNFFLVQMGCGLVKTCLDFRGLPFFRFLYIMLISSFLRTKHCECFFYAVM